MKDEDLRPFKTSEFSSSFSTLSMSPVMTCPAKPTLKEEQEHVDGLRLRLS